MQCNISRHRRHTPSKTRVTLCVTTQSLITAACGGQACFNILLTQSTKVSAQMCLLVSFFDRSTSLHTPTQLPSNHLPSSPSFFSNRKCTTQLKVFLKAAQVPFVDELGMILPTEILSSYIAAWRKFPTKFSVIWDKVPTVFTMIWLEVPVKMATVWGKIPLLLDFVWRKLPSWFAKEWDSIPSHFAQVWNRFPAVFSAVWSDRDRLVNRSVVDKCRRLDVFRTIKFGC